MYCSPCHAMIQQSGVLLRALPCNISCQYLAEADRLYNYAESAVRPNLGNKRSKGIWGFCEAGEHAPTVSSAQRLQISAA